MTQQQPYLKFGYVKYVVFDQGTHVVLISHNFQMLQQAEGEEWRGSAVPYNPLAVHTTVPLIVYENQRLDTRLKTLAVSGGRPKFSASGLGIHGRRAPFELKLPTVDIETGVREVAAWRSDVQLPLRVTPWALPKPEPQDKTHDGAERSHFWLYVDRFSLFLLLTLVQVGVDPRCNTSRR